MSVQRIYHPGLTAGASREDLGAEDYHYVKNVLRLKPGDELLLFDGKGLESRTVIRGFGDKTVLVEIVATEEIMDDSPPLILAQALPKENKMDFIVQKSTELGASSIIPFTSSRTVPKLDPEKALKRVERWRKIAGEAAKQCGASRVPDISEIVPFVGMFYKLPLESIKLFFWEEESTCGIREALGSEEKLKSAPLFIVVGPEGGFSRREVDQARDRGFRTVHLGRRILRAETAPLVILSIIQYERGSLDMPRDEKGE